MVSFFSGQPIPGASFFFGRRRRRRYEHEPPITINEQLETFCFQVVGEQNAAECLQPDGKTNRFSTVFFRFFCFAFVPSFVFKKNGTFLPLLVLPEVYRVVPSFSFGQNVVEWVLLSFTEFYRVLPSFTEFYRVLNS